MTVRTGHPDNLSFDLPSIRSACAGHADRPKVDAIPRRVHSSGGDAASTFERRSVEVKGRAGTGDEGTP